jgi:ABC-type multidrug transport system fused ATPase/permease subunit
MPRGKIPELEALKATWPEMLGPLRYILARYWARAKWMLIGIAALVMFSSVSAVAAPYFFSRLIDTLQAGNWPETILWGFAGYAVLLGLAMSLQSVVSYMSMMSAETLQYVAATSFFARLLKKRIGFFIEYNPVAIQAAQNRGAGAINQVVQLLAVIILPGIVQIFLALAVLGTTINFEIVLVVIGYGLVFIAAIFFSNRYSRPFLEKAIEADQARAGFLGNAVSAMETLRYFGGDEWVGNRFADAAEETRAAWTTWSLRRITFAGVFGGALAIQFIIAFAILLPRYQAGEITIGDLVLLGSLLMQLNRPFEMIGNSIDGLLRAYSQFQPFTFMWIAPEESDGRAGHMDVAVGTIEYKKVGYAYGDKQVVSNVSFLAQRGRVNFLVGDTGSGKTTLFKLALKSLETQDGKVLVDGIDINEIARKDWYSVIGVVPQDIMLLNDTLATNIILGREYDEERLKRATERAAIRHFIEGLKDGFDTKVGERGLKLSGGERQRVAIARALYANPEFLFLDEASSSLDMRTEADIMDELRQHKDEMTIIAITHRKAVIRPEDHVIELPSRRPADIPEDADEAEEAGESDETLLLSK